MALKTSSHVIRCRHKDYAHLNIEIDFSELWEGAPEEKSGSEAVNWAGAFKGRPLMADQIMPTLVAVNHTCKPPVIKLYLSALRGLFRFFNAYEGWAGRQGISTISSKIEVLQDISTHHMLMWKTPSEMGEWKQANWNNYRAATQILREATHRLGLHHLIIPSFARNTRVNFNDVPDEEVGKLLVKALTKEANKIYGMWERSDALAAKGRNLCGIERVPLLWNGGDTGYTTIDIEGGISEADMHATYRAAVAANNELPLDRLQLLKKLGYSDGSQKRGSPRWWPSYGSDHPESGNKVPFLDLQAGLYPTAEQVAVLFLLFLARTGWNPSTAEMLDISDEEKWCKSYTKKFIWLFSLKERANEWQDTVSIIKHRTGAYQIIKRLMARTQKLRRAVEANPSLCANYRIARRSPWLYQRTNQNEATPVRVEVEGVNQRATLRRVIKSWNNAQEDRERHISLAIKPSDMRDIFAAATLVHSNFSLFLTQLALGHKRPSATFAYLRRRAWRAESEQKKNDMFIAIMDQIETHQVIDMTLLRARMDGVTVTEEMLERLESYRKYRTYVDMGCSAPTYPPAYIDPTNPGDGTTHCAQGHLCAGCPHGRVFNDSLPRLARRCAELEWLHDSLPLEAFQDSSLADQLVVIRATLKQWRPKEIESYLVLWKARIVSGEHRPIRFTGDY